MKHRLSLLLVTILACVFLFHACKRNDFNSSSQSLTDPAVALNTKMAKKYYKQLKAIEGNAVTNAHFPGSSERRENRKYLIWQKATEGSTGKATFVEVPLFYNQRPATIIGSDKTKVRDLRSNLKTLNASFDRLIIFKNKTTGKIDQRIVSYIPDKEYLDKHGKDISNNRITDLAADFRGYIKYRRWDGTPLYLLRIDNGHRSKKYAVVYNKTKPQQSRTSSTLRTTTEVCTDWCDVTYVQTCYYTISDEYFSEECSDWEVESSYCWQECYDDGSGDWTGDPCIDFGECGGDPIPPDPTNDNNNDPCAKAKQLEQNADFRSKMQDLTNGADHGTSQNHESAYLMKDVNGSTTYQYFDGGPSGTTGYNFDMSTFGGSSGFIHNHEDNPNNLSIFSDVDFQSLYKIIKDGNVADQNTFTFGLVTADGTSYLLSINDLTKFLNFGDNFLTDSNIGTFAFLYNSFISNTNSADQNEKNFLTLLNQVNGGTGLTLLKGNTGTFTEWKKLSKDANGNVFSTDCN